MKEIYTRTGDDGTTSLHGGIRVKKTDTRIKANGSIDHLNATIGIIRTLTEVENRYFPMEYKAILRDLQYDLMKIMAIIATIPNDSIHGLASEYVENIERKIDAIKSEISMPEGFIVPGGELVGAFLHLARTDARNAEILLWELNDQFRVDAQILAYFNRLSDLLFVMAISLNTDGETWKPTDH